MRSKSDIERTLAHMTTGNCTASSATNAVWIEALEFVLGDDAHQAKYDEFLRAISAPLDDAPAAAGRELLLEQSLRLALLRLQ
jgi:hypothetical protein